MTNGKVDRESRLLTNPVLELKPRLDELVENPRLWMQKADHFEDLLSRLDEEDVRLPPCFTQELVGAEFDIPERWARGEPLRPGVIGLLWETRANQGLVTPLEVEVLEGSAVRAWRIAEHLPFDADELQRLFIELARALDLPPGVPERFAFAIRDRLGQPAEGRSMNIAALLATLHKICDEPPLLGAACALVEPHGTKGLLRASDGIDAKLEAFRREFETGTLLVRHADCASSAAFDSYFDEVWAVESLDDLGRQLQGAGLLDALFKHVTLGEPELRRINARLAILVDEKQDYDTALDLARRVQQCELAPHIPDRVISRTHRALLDSQRHRGSLEVLEEERRQLEELRKAGRFTCFEEIADKAVHYAASCYNPHRFDEMTGVLEPWMARVEKEPLLLSPRLRYMLFNTLARARIAKGESGWRQLLERSLSLQKEVDPKQMSRTRNYLIHGLLRADAFDDASGQIELVADDESLDAYSRQFLGFYRAELARRRGETWEDDELEVIELDTSGLGHPAGFYFQSTARQQGRSTSDRLARFQKARRLFLDAVNPQAQRDGKSSVLYLLATSVGLAEAACAGDTEYWRRERTFLKKFLEPRTYPEMVRYYEDVTARLGSEPDASGAERLLRKVPYF